MQINISLAATPKAESVKKPKVVKVKKPRISVGARVAAEYGKDVWYLGKVLRITDTGCKVEFDDGTSEFLRFIAHRILEVVAPKKSKRTKTYSEVKEISKAALDKAEATRVAAEKAEQAKADQAQSPRRQQRDLEKAKKDAELKRAKYKALSKPAVALLRRWCNAYNAAQKIAANKFTLQFYPSEGGYGAWVLADRKVRILAYTGETLKLYAVPAYPVRNADMTKAELADYEAAVEKIDDVEWNHAEFEYAKFNGRALLNFMHATAKKVGSSIKGLLFDPTKPVEKPTAPAVEKPAEKPAAKKPAIKPAAKKPARIRISM